MNRVAPAHNTAGVGRTAALLASRVEFIAWRLAKSTDRYL
jgi:hypothetical protein